MAYIKGTRVTHCTMGKLQLKRHLQLIPPPITPQSIFLAKKREDLEHFLSHFSYGLCLLTTTNRYEALVPTFKRRHSNWTKIFIHELDYHIGLVMGTIPVLVRLNRRTVNVYMPTQYLSKIELIKNGLTGLRHYRLIRTGAITICGVYSILEAAMTLFEGSPASRLQHLMRKIGEKLVQGQGTSPEFDIQAVAEARGQELTLFVNEMLAAIDRFL